MSFIIGLKLAMSMKMYCMNSETQHGINITKPLTGYSILGLMRHNNLLNEIGIIIIHTHETPGSARIQNEKHFMK